MWSSGTREGTTLALKGSALPQAVSKQRGHAGSGTTSDMSGHIDIEMRQDASRAVAGALFARIDTSA